MRAGPLESAELDIVEELARFAPGPTFSSREEEPPFPLDEVPPDTDREPVQGEGPWEEPVQFYESNLPTFPLDILPSWLSSYCSAIATATQTPVDLSGMLSLGVVAAACAKKIRVQARPGFEEPVNLYIASSLASANRKSQVFKDMVGPIETREADEARLAAPDIASLTSKFKIKERILQRKQEEAAKSNSSDREILIDEAATIARDLAGMRLPVSPRLLADDASPERLQTLLRDHGGRMALMSPEGDVFEIMAGRYSSNGAPNLAPYLKAHSGDTLRVDRVGRPPEFIRDPALTIVLTVQPEVIEGLAQKPGFRGRGLLARFLYSIPQSPLGSRKADAPPVAEEIAIVYQRNMSRLLEIPLRLDEDGNTCARIITMEKQALTSLVGFMGWLEPQLAPLGELGHMSDWAGKLTGVVVRISGLLHMAEHVAETRPWEIPISNETVNCAMVIATYLIAHGKAAFSEMGADPNTDLAKHLLAWIRKEEISEFTKRDAFNANRGRFKKAGDLDGPLELLVDHGYIREKNIIRDSSSRGRKPSPAFEVNPLWKRNCA